MSIELAIHNDVHRGKSEDVSELLGLGDAIGGFPDVPLRTARPVSRVGEIGTSFSFSFLTSLQVQMMLITAAMTAPTTTQHISMNTFAKTSIVYSSGLASTQQATSGPRVLRIVFPVTTHSFPQPNTNFKFPGCT